jgi:hypothetical protein
MFYKITKTLVALFFAILFSSNVVMAEPSRAGVTQAMDKAGFTEKQVAQVESRLDFARQKGLPEDVMVDKLQEGIAKKIAPNRIVQAIERIASRYNHAHQLAGNLVKDEQKSARLGNIVASGMAAGLTVEAAEKIMQDVKAKQSSGTKSYPMAKETMLMARDLSRRGISSETTVDVVERALQEGLNVDEMRAIRGAFNKQGTQSSIESFAKGNMAAVNRSSHAPGMGNKGGSSMGSEGSGGEAGGGSSGTGGAGGSGAGSGSGGAGGGSGSGGGGHR